MLKVTVFTAGLLLSIMSIPVFAKSSGFDFTLKHRVVNGSKNGEYHSLAGGTKPLISGSMEQTGGSTVNNLSNTIYAELLNKTSGNSFGVVTLGKPSKTGKKTSFSGRFTKKTGGGTKYYLIIYRTSSDGRVMSGSGILKD
jgi:hypothetical protein